MGDGSPFRISAAGPASEVVLKRGLRRRWIRSLLASVCVVVSPFAHAEEATSVPTLRATENAPRLLRVEAAARETTAEVSKQAEDESAKAEAIPHVAARGPVKPLEDDGWEPRGGAATPPAVKREPAATKKPEPQPGVEPLQQPLAAPDATDTPADIPLGASPGAEERPLQKEASGANESFDPFSIWSSEAFNDSSKADESEPRVAKKPAGDASAAPETAEPLTAPADQGWVESPGPGSADEAEPESTRREPPEVESRRIETRDLSELGSPSDLRRDEADDLEADMPLETAELDANDEEVGGGDADPELLNEDSVDEGPEGVVVGDQTDPEPPLVLNGTSRRLKPAVESVLMYYHRRPERASERSPWGMLHAMLPYGVDSDVINGRRKYNLIAWMCGNNTCRNQRMLTLRGGRLTPLEGVGLQGHQAQMLAILAQCGVPADYPLYVDRRAFSIEDLVRVEQRACKENAELTFTLIGLSHYLDTDSAWTASDGQRWDFERLLRAEIEQPVVGAACGGTHRLMGLSYALEKRRREGLPIEGEWKRAELYLNDFIAYAWSLQNRDGSFSTEWFEGRGDENDIDRKLQTSGHILEWLIFVTDRSELQSTRMLRGITFLSNTLARYKTREWQVGPKGHALRALSQFHRRLYAEQPPWRPQERNSPRVSSRR